MKAARAFTLVEMLLALAISAMVMAGAVALMFDMGSVMRHFEEGDSFDLHVNGVEDFLAKAFRNSAFPSDLPQSLAGSSASSGAVRQGNPPDSMSGDDRRLCFGVIDDRPFFVARRGFSPEKVAWLDFRRDGGLYVLWTFVKNENADSSVVSESDRPVHESLVSPFVTEFEYVYIDSFGKWTYETDMENPSASSASSTTLPDFVRLKFKRGREEDVRFVPLSMSMDSQFAPSAQASQSQSRSQTGQQGGGQQQGGASGGRGGR